MPEARIVLGREEARFLAALGTRQLGWERGMPVRLRSSGSSLGLFTVPPFDVLVLLAVPAVLELSGGDGDGLDVTIALADLVAALNAAGDDGVTIDLTGARELPVPVSTGMSIAELPPTDGWQVPIAAMSGDVLVSVREAVAEFKRRAAGQSAPLQQQIADEIWNRPGWASLPMRALHAAHRLGMLPDDRSRVSAAVTESWKRLSTSRGQVLVNERVRRRLMPLQLLG